MAGLIYENFNKCVNQVINLCLSTSFIPWDQVTTFQVLHNVMLEITILK